MRNSFYILMFFLAFYNLSFCQNNYLVLKIKSDNIKPNKEYYWIIPDTSISKKGGFNIYPLYIDYFSKNNYEKCLKNDSIDLFTTKDDTNYNFEEKTIKQFDSLKKIILENEVLNQIVVKKHKGFSLKSKEKVSIYITPIEGKFVFCDASEKMEKTIKYSGKICLPVSNFKLDLPFYKSEKISDFLFYSDFSLFNYYNDIE